MNDFLRFLNLICAIKNYQPMNISEETKANFIISCILDLYIYHILSKTLQSCT